MPRLNNILVADFLYLFCNVKCLASVLMLPVAAERFANDGVVRLLQTFRLFVESGQIPLHYRSHPRQGRFLANRTAKIREQKKSKKKTLQPFLKACEDLTWIKCLHDSDSH